MDRFPCNGYLRITVLGNNDTVGIHLSHHHAHCEYVDISIDEDVKRIIEEMKDSPASAVRLKFLHFSPGF
jgi:endonuclease IV